MPSWKNKQREKRRKILREQGFCAFVPNFQRDIKDIFSGKIHRHSPREEKVQAYVQARGL